MKKKEFIWILVAFSAAMVVVPSIAKKSTRPKVQGALVFEQHCASCHTGGGNNVKPSRPVAGSKQLATLAHFKNYLSAPPGHMPYYEHLVNDPETLQALYDYCKSLKKQPLKRAMKENASS
jgi:mono/diheme cytochrome c family protein